MKGLKHHEIWPVKVRSRWPYWVLKEATVETWCLQDQHNLMGGKEQGAQPAQMLKIFESVSQHRW